MKRLSLLLIASLLLSGCTIPFIGASRAGLKIIASPQSSVLLDGKQVGETPYEVSNLKAKSYKLQLVPQSGQPWETTVALRSDLQAVVERIFGDSDQESEGYVMELQDLSNKSSSQLSVVTIPDPSTVRVDGQPKGFAPLAIDVVSDQSHEVIVASAGYNEKRVAVIVPKGFKLQLTVQLSKSKLQETTSEATPSGEPDEKVTPSPTPKASKSSPTPTSKAKRSPTPTSKVTAKPTSAVSPTPPARPYIEVLETPTGWLRVRSEPSTSTDNEIAKIYPGETYAYLESNDSGWYKIKLPDGKEGWISGQYAKLYR